MMAIHLVMGDGTFTEYIFLSHQLPVKIAKPLYYGETGTTTVVSPFALPNYRGLGSKANTDIDYENAAVFHFSNIFH